MSRLVPKDIHGNVILSNSTITPLGAGGIYSGDFIDVTRVGTIYISVYANVASILDGLMIAHSSDGINLDHSDSFTISAGVGQGFSITPKARYLKVLYANGPAAQSQFRLQTITKEDGFPTIARLQDDITDDTSGIISKSTLAAMDSNNDFINLTVTPSGNLKIANAENGLSISRGLVLGVNYLHKFGQAPDFDASDGYVDVWDGANDGGINQMLYQFSTTDDIDSLSSSNAGDTQDIKIYGLDSNFDEVVQTVTLNGQTTVLLTTDLIRVHRMINVDSTDNAGDIYCYVNGTTTGGVPDTAADVRAVIQVGNNQTLMAIYTIPNGKTGYLRSWYVAGSNSTFFTTSGISNNKLLVRPSGEVFQLKHISSLNSTGTSLDQHQYHEPEKLEAQTDIKIMVDSNVTGSSISAGFDLVLIDD